MDENVPFFSYISPSSTRKEKKKKIVLHYTNLYCYKYIHKIKHIIKKGKSFKCIFKILTLPLCLSENYDFTICG